MNRADIIVQYARDIQDTFDSLDGMLSLIAYTETYKNRKEIREGIRAFWRKYGSACNFIQELLADIGPRTLEEQGEKTKYFVDNLHVMGLALSQVVGLYNNIHNLSLEEIAEEAEEILQGSLTFNEND